MSKKNSKLVLAMSTFALLATAGLAAAQGPGPGGPGGPGCPGGPGGPDGAGFGPPAEVLKEFDKNNDGKLDETERKAAHAAMQARRQDEHKKMLAQFDANRDGKLDDAEREKLMEQKATEHFQQIDTNHDGVLSLAEFKAGVRAHHEQMGAGRGHHGRRGPMGPRAGRGGR